MTRMAIIAHGGAGANPDAAPNIQKAVDIGAASLMSGSSALETAVLVCSKLEDDPLFNARTLKVDWHKEPVKGLTGTQQTWC